MRVYYSEKNGVPTVSRQSANQNILVQFWLAARKEKGSKRTGHSWLAKMHGDLNKNTIRLNPKVNMIKGVKLTLKNPEVLLDIRSINIMFLLPNQPPHILNLSGLKVHVGYLETLSLIPEFYITPPPTPNVVQPKMPHTTLRRNVSFAPPPQKALG